MTDSNAERAPLEAAADIVGPRTTEAFSLLGNETRLAVMLALWEAFEPFAEGGWDPTKGVAVPFRNLQKHVGISDSDQLTYHLTKLEGEFVEQTDEGYQLLPAGYKVVRTIIATAGFQEPHLDAAEIELDCPHCGAPTAVTFQNQRLYQVCTECAGSYDLGEKHPPGVLSAWITNPTVLRDRSPAEIFAATSTEVTHEFAMRTGDVCPHCTGQIDSSLDVCEDHQPTEDDPCPTCGRQALAFIQYVCTVCKHTSATSAVGESYDHPAVVGFAWKHGIELGYGSRGVEITRWLNDVESDQELVATDPLRVQVTHRYEDDEVQLTYDETPKIVEVSQSY